MKFILQINHKAEDEAGLNAFLVFLKDNLAAFIEHASAESETLLCSTELEFTEYSEAVTAVQSIRSAFTIGYILKVRK